MRVYLDETVLEHTKERIRYIIEEFDDIVVSVSGGKDSGVTFHLVKQVAEEMGELPIYCLWLDQESEYQSTVDVVEHQMTQDGVIPLWGQIHMEITNGAGHENEVYDAWDPELSDDEYMRPKHDLAIKENTYGSKSLDALFARVVHKEVGGYELEKGKDYPNDIAILGGVRAEESPNRKHALTGNPTYKGITYGRRSKTWAPTSFYPLYDWTYSDIWKYTYENDLKYNDIYDYQYRHGVQIQDMRVSHLHHQQAVGAVFNLQEFEPETYNKLVDRVEGIHATASLDEEGLSPDELPFMFEDWREYRNYLLEKLIDDPEKREGLLKHFFKHDLMTEHKENYSSIVRTHIYAILTNDTRDFDSLKDMTTNIRSDETKEVKLRKLAHLKENEPETFRDLYERGYISHFERNNVEEMTA